jgi:hypothetical protein
VVHHLLARERLDAHELHGAIGQLDGSTDVRVLPLDVKVGDGDVEDQVAFWGLARAVRLLRQGDYA